MHIVAKDLGLRHLWVVYPGDRAYALAENISALPLKHIGASLTRSADAA